MAGEARCPVNIAGTDVGDQQLVLFLMNDVGRYSTELFDLGMAQRAQKDTGLYLFAMALGQFKEVRAAFIFGNVVSAEVDSAIVGYLTTGHGTFAWIIGILNRL